MTEYEIVILTIVVWLNGIFLGYLLWAPNTAFKRGLIDGLTFKFLWSKK